MLNRDLFSSAAPEDDAFVVVKELRAVRMRVEGDAIKCRRGRRYAALLLIAAKLLEAEALYERLIAIDDSAASAA